MSFTSTFAKSALVGALMLGNIAPTEDDYYENDTDFNAVTAQLASGWGWFKLNSASARDRCKGQTNCCPEGYECFGSPQPRPGPPPPPRPPVLPPTPPGAGNCDNNDCGGGSGGGGTAPPKKDPGEEKRKCELRAQRVHNACRLEARDQYDSDHTQCSFIPISNMKDDCISRAQSRRDTKFDSCQLKFDTLKAACQ